MTLSQTAVLTKQIITISFFVTILGLASFIGYKVWLSYYLAHLPKVEVKPDTKFGLLPLPAFPQSNVSSSNYSYSLDTTTGGLPKVGVDPGFEKIIKVYFVVKSFASFLSADRSETLAEKIGINIPPQILSETKYKFEDKGKILNVDLDTGNFSYVNTATISAKQTLDDDSRLVEGFKNILTNLGVLKSDLKTGVSKIALARLEGDNLITTQLRSEATAAQISLWPAPVDKKPIVTPRFNKSLVNAIVANDSNQIESYLSLNFIYYQIDTTTFATYPTKQSEQAIEDLKSGKGVIIVQPIKPQVSITSVYLGYYLGENYSPYLQPVFVFEGPNFVAYVPAITEAFQSQTK